MNRMEILGRAGSDGELKYLQNGTAVLEVALADSRKQGETYVTQWFKVVLYGVRAQEMAELVTKGCEVWALGNYEKREVTRNGAKTSYDQLNADYFRVILGKQKE